MAKTVSLGYTDTAIEGVASLNFARGLLNYGADWRVKPSGNGDLLLVNKTNPLGRQPERLRYGFTEIANVYNGSSISPAYQSPSVRGISLLVQLNEVWSETDDADPTYRVDAPIQAHLVLKFPQADFVTAARLEAAVGRLISGVYDTGVTTTSRLDALMRGSLTPSDV